MAFQDRFTNEEQILLSSVPTLVGSAMTFAGGSGLGTVKEMIANSKALIQGSKDNAANEIISGILPQMTSMSQSMDQAKVMRERLNTHMAGHMPKDVGQLKELAISDAKKASELLAAKATPEEAQQYKAWVLKIAEEVANAAKEGGFLGFGGERVSANEKELFEQVAQALAPLSGNAGI